MQLDFTNFPTNILNLQKSEKAFTLNFVATLNFCESAPPDLNKGPTTGFSDCTSMLDANFWGRELLQEDKS